MYEFALAQAGVATELVWLQGGSHAEVTGRTYAFELPSERSVLFAADAEGKILAVYRPDEVHLEVI